MDNISDVVSDLNYIAILVAAVSTFAVGGLWYSPMLFAKPWMAASGLTEEEAKKGNAPMIFGGAFILALIAAFILAMFIY
nr:DUF1761 domain-containing protein [Bacteroidota bacterium]